MLAAMLPLFDENLTVSAYSLFSQKENLYMDPRFALSAMLDGAPTIDGLEILAKMGLETITSGRNVFVPVNNVSIFADIEVQCLQPHDQVVIFIDNLVKPTETYIKRIRELKAAGFKLAIRKIPVTAYEIYKPILSEMDFIFLNYKKIDISKAKIYFSSVYPNIKLIAGNVSTMEDFENLKKEGGYDLYEGDFYRMPVTKGLTEVSPLKMNYIQLMNTVNEENFELTEAADIISRDTALVLELLQIVNRMSRNGEITTIRHAAAMLGQKELRKWILTAVTKQMCLDKPNEITRVSLIRAKFAENLAPLFGVGGFSSELFLLGLFSVVDIILDKPMAEALELIKVSAKIKTALCDGSGEYGPVYEMVQCYEKADWQEVSRLMVLKDIKMEDIYKAYCDALVWYREAFFSGV